MNCDFVLRKKYQLGIFYYIPEHFLFLSWTYCKLDLSVMRLWR